MTSPPPYYSVWSPKDERCFANYESSLYGTYYRKNLFWFVAGYSAVIAGQLFCQMRGLTAVPTFFRHPFIGLTVGLFAGVVFPGSLFVQRKRVKTEAMDKLLRSGGTFLAAKMRHMADDIFWPEADPERLHNRCYLESLPRDKWDEFVWTVNDDDIAFDRIEPDWSWAKYQHDTPQYDPVVTLDKMKLDTKSMPFKKYITYLPSLFYQVIGYGFEYDDYVINHEAEEHL